MCRPCSPTPISTRPQEASSEISPAPEPTRSTGPCTRRRKHRRNGSARVPNSAPDCSSPPRPSSPPTVTIWPASNPRTLANRSPRPMPTSTSAPATSSSTATPSSPTTGMRFRWPRTCTSTRAVSPSASPGISWPGTIRSSSSAAPPPPRWQQATAPSPNPQTRPRDRPCGWPNSSTPSASRPELSTSSRASAPRREQP